MRFYTAKITAADYVLAALPAIISSVILIYLGLIQDILKVSDLGNTITTFGAVVLLSLTLTAVLLHAVSYCLYRIGARYELPYATNVSQFITATITIVVAVVIPVAVYIGAEGSSWLALLYFGNLVLGYPLFRWVTFLFAWLLSKG